MARLKALQSIVLMVIGLALSLEAVLIFRPLVRKIVELSTELVDEVLILDLAEDTVFIRDSEDRIRYWNQGAQRLYGWSKEETLGQVTHHLLKTQFPQPLSEIEEAHLLRPMEWRTVEAGTHRLDV